MRDVEIPEPAHLKCRHDYKVKETQQGSTKLFN